MLFTADPVRDRAWWLRTGVYGLVLVAQDPGDYSSIPRLVVLAAVIGVCGLAVDHRDRHPLALAILGLALSASVAETPVTLGIVAVASRAPRWPAIAYAAGGAGAMMLPWPRMLTSGITVTGSDAVVNVGDHAMILLATVALPLMIGMQRRARREVQQERLAFESEQRQLAASQAVIEERNRIAQEMHDVLGHKLSLISVQAGALEMTVDDAAPAAAQQAELIRTTSKAALDDLRSILGVLGEGEQHELHPQPGLAETLTLIEHNRASGMRITLKKAQH